MLTYIQKKNIYNQAKKDILADSIKFSQCLKAVIELNCEKYEAGLISLYYAIGKHDEKIDSMIDCYSKKTIKHVSKKRKNTVLRTEEYLEIMLEIGLSIVKNYPSKALVALNHINKEYEKVGSLPHGTIELSVEIVCTIANSDIEQALEFIRIIEVDYFRLEALEKILTKTDTTLYIGKVQDAISKVKHNLEVKSMRGNEQVENVFINKKINKYFRNKL